MYIVRKKYHWTSLPVRCDPDSYLQNCSRWKASPSEIETSLLRCYLHKDRSRQCKLYRQSIRKKEKKNTLENSKKQDFFPKKGFFFFFFQNSPQEHAEKNVGRDQNCQDSHLLIVTSWARKAHRLFMGYSTRAQAATSDLCCLATQRLKAKAEVQSGKFIFLGSLLKRTA